jgi:hypothetical protein
MSRRTKNDEAEGLSVLTYKKPLVLSIGILEKRDITFRKWKDFLNPCIAFSQFFESGSQ